MGVHDSENRAVLVVAASVVVVAIILTSFVFLWNSGGAVCDQTSPENLMNLYIEKRNEGDWDGLFDVTVYSLASSNRSAYCDSVIAGFDMEEKNFRLASVERKESSSLDQSTENEISVIISKLEEEVYAQIDDYAVVYTKIKSWDVDVPRERENEWLCLEVDGLWYLYLDHVDYYMQIYG